MTAEHIVENAAECAAENKKKEKQKGQQKRIVHPAKQALIPDDHRSCNNQKKS